ncbi:DUF2244 domain-containing protein [Govanella unica]|uniref:DUF2244 domain-containing protein n=1 Tax=Govanella unica TaxID=2975056 RepID=A0A9X3TZW4_9PROT|nr:DUF2244 domain-containing protein [Govania unica]MDA5194663.1 DUF2244 domain-containing protein [Govania unica]
MPIAPPFGKAYSRAMDATLNRLRFSATLHPHRSLSRRGFKVLMCCLGLLSCLVGFVFISIGAWPVFGFFGLDVLGVYWAFQLSYRASTSLETIRLTDDNLTVGRLSPKGKYEEWQFQPYWVRVQIAEPRPYEVRVTLTSHGRNLEIGRFLSPAERLEVAEALNKALGRLCAGQV